ncbi:MAG: hypothetical protein R3B89_17030 [Polyangiaceae bacterium]
MNRDNVAVLPPPGDARALRTLVAELRRGETSRWRTTEWVEPAAEILEALAHAMPGDRYHHVYWWKKGQQAAARAFCRRLRAGSLRTISVFEKLDPNLWLMARAVFAHVAPDMWGGSIKEDRPLPRQRYRRVVTASRNGIPAELRFKPRSRLKFACEAPANQNAGGAG